MRFHRFLSLALLSGIASTCSLTTATATSLDPVGTAHTDALAALPGSVASTSHSAGKESLDARLAFNKLVDDFYADAMRVSPNFATGLGIHTHDSEMADCSQAAIAQRSAQLKAYRAKFAAIDGSKLEKTLRLDRAVLISSIDSELLELEVIKDWQHSPDTYSSTAFSSIFDLVKRDFAPLKERLQSVIARMRKIPELLAQGKANLVNPPKVFTEVALQQMPGTIAYFEKSVQPIFAAVDDTRLQAELAEANKNAVAALKDYESFLKTTVLPKSNGSFALGQDTYAKKLKYDEMVDEPLDKLLAKGYAELHRLQKDFADTARQIDSTKPAREVFDQIAKDHPTADQLIQSVQSVLNTLRDDCTGKKIVSIPGETNLKVDETPPSMRALTFASMDTPGPFEENTKQAFYYVTLPEKDWSATKAEEHMRSFSMPDLTNTSVHEAYPGHYVQGLWMKQAPSKTRKIVWSNGNGEGWAHYCEDMMAREVYPADKKLRLVQLHDALLRCSRYIAAISMHTQGMTLPQAITLFEKEGYQEHANAEREAKRGTMDPTYLVYTLGKMQIYALRDEYKKAKGAQYTLKGFHDDFLSQGAPPIKVVRAALLNKPL